VVCLQNFQILAEKKMRLFCGLRQHWHQNPEIEMRQEEAPIVVFQDGEKAIGRIHQIVDEIYAAL